MLPLNVRDNLKQFALMKIDDLRDHLCHQYENFSCFFILSCRNNFYDNLACDWVRIKKTYGVIKHGQSRDTGSIGYKTNHKILSYSCCFILIENKSCGRIEGEYSYQLLTCTLGS